MSEDKNQKCVCCGFDWKERKQVSYSNLGSKSVPMVYGMSLLSNNYRIHLIFCDLHGNNHIHLTRTFNGQLQINNVNTKQWVNAEDVGELVV